MIGVSPTAGALSIPSGMCLQMTDRATVAGSPRSPQGGLTSLVNLVIAVRGSDARDLRPCNQRGGLM